MEVKHKVHWPHEAIFGGTARQRVTYNQLTLTQWVQGFCRNILEEKSRKRKDLMVAYLGDLMEDATDFSWQGVKAAHARWRGGQCDGKTQTVWTESVGHMPKNTSQQVNKIRLVVTKNHGFVKIIKPMCVPTKRTMR